VNQNNKRRLVGIDLFRGIAAFAVAVLHSGDATIAPVSTAAMDFRYFFRYPVIFFLATSFYFFVHSSHAAKPTERIISRVKRVLIPYVIWSLLYLLMKGLQFFFSAGDNKFSDIFRDPVSSIFFGGVTVHLYFLPLLFIGTIAAIASESIFKNPRLEILLILFFISLIGYDLMISSGNDFILGPNIAFRTFTETIIPGSSQNSVIRLVAVQIAWMIRCLPYIFLARFIKHVTIQKYLQSIRLCHCILLIISFITLNISHKVFISTSVNELAVAFTGLLSAISISKYLQNYHWIEKLGICSFGIYLIHVSIIRIEWILLKKLFPSLTYEITILNILLLSTSSFMIAWLITHFILKRKKISTFLFGV
jgi:peptidoglycan/LPS O-acetylase OafA/YrhL